VENFFLIVLCSFPIFLTVGFFAFLHHRIRKKSRYPINVSKTQKIPGFSLLVKLKELQYDIGMRIGLTVAVGLIPFAQVGVYTLFGKPLTTFYLSAIFTFLVIIWLLIEITKSFKSLQNIRLGLETEWAVAEELNHIREPDVTVFHDVQAENFNIDHVVTSPHGIIAVETKGRRKPNVSERDKSYRVELNGNNLIFPNYTDTKIIPQTVRQAKWLTNHLANAAGERFAVTPAVVIPGWFVEIKTKPTVLAWPLNKLRSNYRHGMKQQLLPEQLKRVNHQLSILCQRNSVEF